MAKQDSESEQKSLPASEKKLRDGRKKGQVSSSRDFISGFGLLAMIVYLLLVWPTLRDHILELVNLLSRVAAEPYDRALQQVLPTAIDVLWISVVPGVIVLIFVSVVAGMVATFGPVFSFEMIKPNFEHINPASGLKRIFSMRNSVEFAKGALKVLILGTVFFLVLRSWLQPMFHLANCGESCIVPVLLSSLLPIAAVAALSFILIGFVDIRVQRWLFLRDMRMTKTEHKRERKDIEGDPLIMGERKKERQRRSKGTFRLGLPTASIVLDGRDQLVGLLYHPKNAPLPIIVAKSRAERAEEMRDEARELGIPVIRDEDLSRDLVEQHALGDYLSQKHFPAVAAILVSQKLT